MAPHAVANNPYEALSREVKARKIVAVLEAADCDAETAEYLNESAWIRAAEKAGVNKPSPKTRAVVISMLQDAEALRDQVNAELDGDVLKGLPRA